MSVFTRTALAAALLAAAPLAFAATADDTMTVSITIENSCTIAANDLAFGPQNTLAADIEVSTTVDVVCTAAGPLSIDFTAGGGASATFASRQMTHALATDTINYTLYSDSARTNVLGGAVVLAGTSTGGTDSFPVYGRVFGGQGAKPVGSYSDTVTATVTF